jgi:hypothetical protein
MEKVLLPLSFIDVTILHLICSFAVLQPLVIVSRVGVTIVPGFTASPVRHIPPPLAFVQVTILADIATVTMRVIVHPATLVATAVWMS